MKRIVIIVFLSFIAGFLFGAAIFIKNTPQEKNQDVKSIIAVTSPTQTSSLTKFPKKDLYQVVKVIDGDTISVKIDGKIEAVRLIGIDSPESVDPRKPVQCFGKEASDKAREILIGKKVSLEYDPTQGEKDKYKRLLRYVFLEDGQNFNKLMIESGYAHEYTYKTSYKYQKDFKLGEVGARERRLGLWGDDACVNPTQSLQGPTSSAEVENGDFSCVGKKTCGQMTGCSEAYFYLNNCGLSRLDADKDGVPCESLCR